MNTKPIEQQRAEFEAWVRSGPDWCLRRNGDGYDLAIPQSAWLAWQEQERRHAEEMERLRTDKDRLFALISGTQQALADEGLRYDFAKRLPARLADEYREAVRRMDQAEAAEAAREAKPEG